MLGKSLHLDLDGQLHITLLLLDALLGVLTHDATTPVTTILLVLVGVALLDRGDDLAEL